MNVTRGDLLSKQILNLSIAVFFLTFSLILILGGIRVEKTLTQHEENMAIQKEVYEDMKAFNGIVYEGALAVGARILAAEDVMSQLEADKIVEESISRIEEKDSRLGQFAKSINDATTGRR